MEIVLAFVIGAVYTAGIYLLLRRSLVKLLLGIGLLGNGANLLIFTAAGLVRGRPPIVAAGAQALDPPHADPLPQALVLTAIVIGFGVLAFAMVLFKRAYREVGSEDLDHLKATES
jgi:multicomponent Na+:H+ antiporter subunit C